MSKETRWFAVALVLLAGICVAALWFFFGAMAGVVGIAGFTAVGICVAVYGYRRRRAVVRVNEAVRHMIEGGFPKNVRDNDEGVLSALKNDVSDLAERLVARSDLLEDEKTALQNHISDIAHQMKTPLTSMQIMADLLEDSDLPPEKHDEFYENLRTSLTRMEWLVASLLKMARLDSGGIVFKKERVSFSDLVDDAVRHVEILLDVKGQRIEKSYVGAGDDSESQAEDICFLCDRAWTTEALGNILKNASEYTPENGTIRVSAGENLLHTWLSVTDEGPGIPPKDLPYLFRRFHRSAASISGGAGIGLAMSLSIMQKQDGDIEVQNEANGGATFLLKFYKTGAA